MTTKAWLPTPLALAASNPEPHRVLSPVRAFVRSAPDGGPLEPGSAFLDGQLGLRVQEGPICN